jgi:hypothetical protein
MSRKMARRMARALVRAAIMSRTPMMRSGKKSKRGLGFGSFGSGRALNLLDSEGPYFSS